MSDNRPPTVYRIDETTAFDLAEIRKRLGMSSNEEVVLRAIGLLKIAAQEALDGTVYIVARGGKRLPVKLVG
jgi:hypothetical protein